MITTISLVNIHPTHSYNFFPCDENFRSTLLATFKYTIQYC